MLIPMVRMIWNVSIRVGFFSVNAVNLIESNLELSTRENLKRT